MNAIHPAANNTTATTNHGVQYTAMPTIKTAHGFAKPPPSNDMTAHTSCAIMNNKTPCLYFVNAALAVTARSITLSRGIYNQIIKKKHFNPRPFDCE